MYRALLRAYPERTRRALGEDMVQLFRDRLRDADSPLARAAIWVEAISDIAVTAPREHLARRAVATVAEGPSPGPPAPTRPMRPDLAAASVPLVIAILAPLILPGYYEPLFDSSIGIGGLPVGIAMLVLSTILAAIGIFGARRGGVRDPQVQLAVLAVLLSPLLLLAAIQLLPVSLWYLIAVLLLVAWDPDRAPAIALGGVVGPVLALPWLLGSGPGLLLAAAYVAAVTLATVAARIGWLLYTLALPLILVLLLGPAAVLILVNLRG